MLRSSRLLHGHGRGLSHTLGGVCVVGFPMFTPITVQRLLENVPGKHAQYIPIMFYPWFHTIPINNWIFPYKQWDMSIFRKRNTQYIYIYIYTIIYIYIYYIPYDSMTFHNIPWYSMIFTPCPRQDTRWSRMWRLETLLQHLHGFLQAWCGARRRWSSGSCGLEIVRFP